MARQLKKKTIYLNLGTRKFRHTEIIEELFDFESEIIDLTKDDKPSLSKRRAAAKSLRLKIPKSSSVISSSKDNINVPTEQSSQSSVFTESSSFEQTTPFGRSPMCTSPYGLNPSPQWPGENVDEST